MTIPNRTPPAHATCHLYTSEDLKNMAKHPVKARFKIGSKSYALYMTGTKSECQRVGKKRKKLVGSLCRTIKLPSWHEDQYALYTHTDMRATRPYSYKR